MQIVIAGKAHPKDHPGKIADPRRRAVSRAIRELWKHIVFIEDYDMKVARELVQGVRPLAQHAAARRRGLWHQRHEGRHERRAEPQHPGRLVR